MTITQTAVPRRVPALLVAIGLAIGALLILGVGPAGAASTSTAHASVAQVELGAWSGTLHAASPAPADEPAAPADEPAAPDTDTTTDSGDTDSPSRGVVIAVIIGLLVAVVAGVAGYSAQQRRR